MLSEQISVFFPTTHCLTLAPIVSDVADGCMKGRGGGKEQHIKSGKHFRHLIWILVCDS